MNVLTISQFGSIIVVNVSLTIFINLYEVKIMKRKLLITILVVISCIFCTFGIAACNGDKPNGDGQGTIQTPPEEKPDDKDEPSDVLVTGVTLSKTTLSLEVGDNETLTATVAPNNATDKTVTWKSSDYSVAKVENGKVTALKAGTATITATAGRKSATCKVTVTEKVVPHTHDLTLVPAKQADCETAGNTAYYTCDCGKWFSDSAAENEITDKNSVNIKATGHSYAPEWTYNETQHWHKAICAHTALTTAPQNHTFENDVCSVCGYINDLLIFKTLEVNDDIVYGKFSNSTTDFSFIKEITANANVTYTVCTDKECEDIIPSKTVDLNAGDNVFYVLATKGNNIKLYTVTLRRRPVYTVTFDTDGGSVVAEQKIEEDSAINQTETPLKTGYTFSNWKIGDKDITLPYAVTETLTLRANYTANEYTVTFDLSEGDVLETLTAKVTYGEQSALPVPENEAYSFMGWYYGTARITNSQGVMISKWSICEDVSLTSKHQTIFEVSNGVVTGLTSEGKQFTEIEVLPKINGEEITSIGDSAFWGCNWLTSVTIGDSVTSIENSAFRGCSGLTSVTIGESVTSIGNSAFRDCSGLMSVTIPDNVTSIGDWAFNNCSGLTSVTIGNSVKSIGGYAFYNCSGLTSITIPDSVTTIGDSAFFDCIGLTSVTIGNSVTTIGSDAFNGCIGLTSVIWNAIACTTAGSSSYPIFGGCTKLATVTFGENATQIPAYAFYDYSGLRSVTIPDSVTTIGNFAFYNCSGLASVIIPDSVTTIGDYAFGNCNRLTSVTIGNSVTSIGGAAFVNCSRLTSVTIGDSVTIIGNSAFCYCGRLTSVTIGNGVTTIEMGVFSDCSSLESITVSESNANYASQDGILYNKDKTQFIHIPKAIKGAVIIPEGVTSISDFAFEGCGGLTSVTIGNSVTSIGNRAFRNCSGLTSVDIPDSVTSIGYDAFNGCSGLTEINYRGTKEEWNSIRKSSNWNSSTGNYTIHCTDGEIKKS